MTVFYELQGEGARERLGAFARTLEKAGIPAELLESTAQSDLFLLMCRPGEATLPAPAPAGTKVWQFRAVR